MARERKTRFAGGALGYVWAYITPAVWIALIVGLFICLERRPPIDAGLEVFVATGILPYVIFRQTVTALSRVLSAHRYMRYFSAISTDNILWSSMLLEGLNLLVSALMVFGTVTLVFGAGLPEALPRVLFALWLTWMLGCGIGRFAAIAGQMSDTFARSLPLVLRPFFWLSGIFYTAAELPGPVQEMLWYSPFLHVTEIMREGYFLGFSSQFADAWYPIAVAAGFFLASVPLEQFAKKRRIMRGRL
ncbi:ABC transporter permease [Mameliella alba]|nr:ABC transporter permease [Mameliella alba]MBY6177642.1 ABC transporter permease [Mameliella alba]